MQNLNSSIGTPRRGWLLALALLIAATVAMVAPRPAAAGEFTITACQADAGNFASGAFENFATRGMRWRRACNPLGPGLRGLVTANVVTGSRVAHGAQSAFVLNAPPGTAFSRLRWSGHAQRRDCRYALQMYAVRPDGSDATIKNVRANKNCPAPEAAQASSWPRPRAYDLGGATKIVQRVVCVGAPSGQFCSGRGLNYMQTFTAEATVVDTSGPSVTIVPDTPLARGEWVSGTQASTTKPRTTLGSRVRSRTWLAPPMEKTRGLRLLPADSLSERPGPDRSRNRTHRSRRHPIAACRGGRCRRQQRRIGDGHGEDRQHGARHDPGRHRRRRSLAKPQRLRRRLAERPRTGPGADHRRALPGLPGRQRRLRQRQSRRVVDRAARQPDRARARRMGTAALARRRRRQPAARKRLAAGQAALRPRTSEARLRRPLRRRPDAGVGAGDRSDLRARGRRNRDQPSGLGHLAGASNVPGKQPSPDQDRRRGAARGRIRTARHRARSGRQPGEHEPATRRAADEGEAAASDRLLGARRGDREEARAEDGPPRRQVSQGDPHDHRPQAASEGRLWSPRSPCRRPRRPGRQPGRRRAGTGLLAPREGEEALVDTLTTGAHGHFAYALDARASQALRFAYRGPPRGCPPKTRSPCSSPAAPPSRSTDREF